MTTTISGAFRDAPVVLMDLDVNMIDSSPGVMVCLGYAYADFGDPHLGREWLLSFIGPPLSESFRDELGMSAERAERMRLAYAEHYLDEGIKASVPFPGMRELIGRLVAERRTVAVATNKPELTARRQIGRASCRERGRS